MDDKQRFLYPRSRYYGSAKPEYFLFNDNLQEFAHRTGYICNLHTAGKISSSEAFEQLQVLWQSVERSKHSLNIQDS